MGRWARYAQTKWANYVFTIALHEKLVKKGSKVKVLVAHPGIAATNLQVTTVVEKGMPSFAANMLVSQSSNDGALGITRCSCDSTTKSGELYGPKNEGWSGAAELAKPDPVTEADKKTLWDESEKSCGISFSV